MHIIEDIKFINVKNLRILCIPEKYGVPEEEYRKVLFESGGYDICLLHGTYKGSFKGSEVATLNSNHAPVFSMSSFVNCAGPILMGHYHISGCYDSYAYYNGSTFRYQFGEEQPKGFLILLHNLDTQEYAVEMEEIVSFKYNTLHLDQILLSDPNEIIKYLEKLKADGIDYIKLKVDKFNNNIPIIREYFRGQDWIKIDSKKAQVAFDTDIESKYQNLEFLTDPSIDEYTKFVMYVNSFEGEGFLTIEKLKEILKGE